MTNYTPYNTPQFRDGTGAITQSLNDISVKLATTQFVLNQLINSVHLQIITVKSSANPLLNEFTSIANAVNSITDSSSIKPYIINVNTGVYLEPLIDMSNKPNISIVGSSIGSTIIKPIGNNDLFKMGLGCELSFLTIRDVPNGKIAIIVNDIGDFAQLHKISMYDNDTHIKVTSSTQDTVLYMEYVDINGAYTIGIDCIASNGFASKVNSENFYCFPTSLTTHHVRSDGLGANVHILTGGIIGINTEIALLSKNQSIIDVTGAYIEQCSIGGQCQDNATLRVFNTSLDNIDKNIFVPNIGSTPFIELLSLDFGVIATQDIDIQNPTTLGIVNGFLDTSKFTSNSNNLAINYTDGINKSFNVLGDLRIGKTKSSLVDITDLNLSKNMGLITGGDLSIVSGLTIQILSGFGYALVSDYPNKAVIKVIFPTQNLLLTANTENYIYFNNAGVITSSSSLPDIKTIVYLGRVVTNGTGIAFIDTSKMNINHLSNELSLWIREVFSSQFITGSIVTENVTPLHLNVTSGVYRLAENKYIPSGGNNITFSNYYRNGANWSIQANQNTCPLFYDDNSGTLQALSTNHYTNHVLYLVGHGSLERYFLVIGQNEFNSLVLVENADLPTPPSFFNQSCLPIAKIIVRNGTANIIQIDDLRPRPLSASSVTSSVTDHNDLTGRELPSGHTWALDVSGSNQMLANLNMGTFQITNAGLINGVNIASHASRHQHNGSDEIATITPVGSGIPKALPSGLLDINWLPIITIAKGGHGQATAISGFNALSPLTTKGDILTRDGTNNIRLAVDAINNRIISSDSTTSSGLAYKTIGSLFDPKYEYFAVDDFNAGAISSSLGWISSVSGTAATATIDTTQINSNHTGFVALATGTTATGRSSILTNISSILLGGGLTKVKAVIYIPTLSDATQRYNLRLLLGDNIASGDFVDGIYFEYDDSLSANWRICTSSNSVRTKTNTGTAVTTGFVELSFILNSAGSSVEFFVNGVSVGTNITNIPTGAGRVLGNIFKIEKTIGTTSRTVLIDYFYSHILFNTPR
jgi:hypothetical protein